MTLRERLADWISGWALSREKSHFDGAIDRLHVMTVKYFNVQQRRIDETSRANLMRRALSDIAAMETPNCAPIGKRMAKRAKEALK